VTNPASILMRHIESHRRTLDYVDGLICAETNKPFSQRDERVLVFLGVERRIYHRLITEMGKLVEEVTHATEGVR
jgi:hypothetical protein